MKYPTLIVTLALLSSAGFAQIPLQINEIYASHASTDDQEMIELRGAPTTSLDGHMVLVVEGDGNPAGVLDRAWDLTGYSIPARGYFVLGDTGVTQKDYDLGASNRIENGTNTIYLISTSDTSKITALVGKDVDSDKDLVTDIVGLATIVDIIGMADKGFPATDKVYDSAAAIGPDGSYGPAGIFRDESTATNAWCTTLFLDFDHIANANAIRTPGATNTTCTAASLTTSGSSCLTGAGTTGGPDLNANLPVMGKSFDIAVSNAGSGAVGLLYLGVPDKTATFLGCRLYLNPAVLLLAGTFTFSSGTGKIAVPVPVSTTFVGLSFSAQAAVGTAASLHLTNAISGVVGYN
ncbi:MAG: hypothetical protein VX951_05175 [Planctomycetota bacterium]|nr:hypothetical protein [Planctomycetota bacterium]